MNKTEFINTLANTLKERNIKDIDEIIAEYEQHFKFKLADGYSEERIAARLGDPKALGKQFDSQPTNASMGSKLIVTIGLAFADLISAVFFVLLFAWVIVMAAAAVVFGVVGVCLILNLNISGLLLGMPYFVGFIFGIMSFAFTVLTAVGTIYFWFFTRQLLRSYCRWHRNLLASAGGEAVLPSIPAHPHIPAARNRTMRKITLIALSVFAITFLSGFIIAMLAAGAFQFWHVWGWFR